jgi:hypothetical protein
VLWHFYAWHFKLADALNKLNILICTFFGFGYLVGLPFTTLSIYMLFKVSAFKLRAAQPTTA